MNQRRSTLFAWSLAILAVTFASGCETGFVANAARESIASFVTSIVTTAVNESINPSD